MSDIASIVAPLFVPADRPDRFAKAASSGADAIILDLEDAVGRESKDDARRFLDTAFTTMPVLVRINSLGTPWHEADLRAVKGRGFAGIIVPKAEDKGHLQEVACLLGIPVFALVESAVGLVRAREIASATGVERLAFGSIDFCADLGCSHIPNALLFARQELVLASRLAQIAGPLDGVTARVGDTAATETDAAHARSLGMTGKLCIHPNQIGAVFNAFAPSAEEIAWAERVLGSGDGVVSVDGEMIDEPVRVRARGILIAGERRAKLG
ncbi:HpcH/HpaI aldolase/citrate lyase family protein [Sphingobium fuliginis]|uniref:CoA ester lyase n=1 Tax=Sphingobium fuliginis ATCC 27551 TaxID=1208342 RepID=A0A5B8CFV5_SPHSA|nr:CoA ester lyase [Sphingobium fuliginis]QDC38243.1 CoA ester lyase [Sphingobium fuliginis ATCC 27551]